MEASQQGSRVAANETKASVEAKHTFPIKIREKRRDEQLEKVND